MSSSSIVDDHCAPAAVDRYTQEDLDAFSLRELYARSCAKQNVKPVSVITDQLPNEPGDHHHVSTLNATTTYLGSRSAAALVPIIGACPRLVDLHLVGIGMGAAVAKALIPVLSTHPGIKSVDLSKNNLGVAVGEKLLRLVLDHRRIHTLVLDHCLIVTPVLKKIKAQLVKNFEIRDSFSIPLIPDRVSAAEIAAAELRAAQERQRQLRMEAERRRLAELIPPWAPAALLDLHQTLHKHRHHMPDAFSVFRTTNAGDRVVDPKNFVRAMKIMDVRTLSEADGAKICELGDLFSAWDRTRDVVNFHTVIAALRTHATIVRGPNAKRGVQLPTRLTYLVDAVYDARTTLLMGFETIDVDMTDSVSLDEVIVGIQAIASAPSHDVRDLLRFALVALPDPPLPPPSAAPDETTSSASPAHESALTATDDAGDNDDAKEEAAGEEDGAAVPKEDGDDTPSLEVVGIVDTTITPVELPARVSYRQLLDAVAVSDAHDASVPRPDWDLKRAQLRAIGAAACPP